MGALQKLLGDRFRLGLHPAAAGVLALALLVLGGVGLFRVTGALGGTTAGHAAPAEVVAVADPTDPMSDIEPLGHGLGGGRPNIGSEGTVGGGSAAALVVHVTGAVKDPGVVTLAEGSRVVEAVEGAGGVTAEADLASVNLAAVVADGMHIHVAKEGEPGFAPQTAGTPDVAAAPGGGGGCVDVNLADVTALQALDGVGPKLAQRIVDHRDSNGPFNSVSDLTQVSGIGPVLVERIAAGACQ